MKRITSFLLAIVLFAGLALTAAPTAYAASNMTSSDMLVETVKEHEGFTAYPCWDYGQYSVLASFRQMSRQLSRGSAGEYQADEQAGVAGLRWRVSGSVGE